jgi:hypothetical protein
VTAPARPRGLLEWVGGDSPAENWSNINFGDGSPEELTSEACDERHGPQASANQPAAPLLAIWDHCEDLAFDNTLAPTDEAILLASTRAHALARNSASFVPLIVSVGLAHAGGMGAMMLAVLGDLWAPRR